MRIKTKIFKKIPELDAEIRTIENPDDKDKTENYYIVEVGLYESLGERGEIVTFLYDNKPTEEEIITDTRQNLKEALKVIMDAIGQYPDAFYSKNPFCSTREERYLEILNKLAEDGKI